MLDAASVLVSETHAICAAELDILHKGSVDLEFHVTGEVDVICCSTLSEPLAQERVRLAAYVRQRHFCPVRSTRVGVRARVATARDPGSGRAVAALATRGDRLIVGPGVGSQNPGGLRNYLTVRCGPACDTRWSAVQRQQGNERAAA